MNKHRLDSAPLDAAPRQLADLPPSYRRSPADFDRPLSADISVVGDCALFGSGPEHPMSPRTPEDEVQLLLSRVQRQLDTSRHCVPDEESQPRWRKYLRQKAREMAIVMPLITGSTITRTKQ